VKGCNSSYAVVEGTDHKFKYKQCGVYEPFSKIKSFSAHTDQFGVLTLISIKASLNFCNVLCQGGFKYFGVAESVYCYCYFSLPPIANECYTLHGLKFSPKYTAAIYKVIKVD